MSASPLYRLTFADGSRDDLRGNDLVAVNQPGSGAGWVRVDEIGPGDTVYVIDPGAAGMRASTVVRVERLPAKRPGVNRRRA